MKWVQLGVLALLLGGCDGAKAFYDAVAATGDHTKPPIPLARQMDAMASAAPSAGPSSPAAAAPTAPPATPAPPQPTPSDAPSAEPSPTPSPTATPPSGERTYDAPYFSLRYDAARWALQEASVEQALMGDAAYLVQPGTTGLRMAIVDDPVAKSYERDRDEAIKRMARLRFTTDDRFLAGQPAWEAFGLIGSGAATADPDDDDEDDNDEDEPKAAAPDALDAAVGKVTYYISCTRDGRTFGLRLELDGTIGTSAADQQVEHARALAVTWRWKY